VNVICATRLTGGSVVLPDGTIEALDVLIDGGRIAGLVTARTPVEVVHESIDVSGRIVAPGLIDVQINGGWGCDFTSDASTIASVAAHLPSTGVTAFCPTVVTSTNERRLAAIEAMSSLHTSDGSATALGLHFEGPAISPVRPGAHNPKRIGMPPGEQTALWSRSNHVSMVTLAPELPGALDLIARLRADGVVVSAGHTDCSSGEFADGRTAGVTMVTHLFNAMGPFSHRDPGPIGAALADDSVRAGIICDGIHVDRVAVAMAWRALGPERMILVTDAVAALGMPAGTLTLGDFTVTVSDRGVRTADDVLAGSNLSLDQAIRNLVEFTGCSPGEAIRAATANPADLLGLPDRGRIAVGARADLVVLDKNLQVEQTIIACNQAWPR
jgi:N-acetylglucosamine-6-phosphate deacetylase